MRRIVNKTVIQKSNHQSLSHKISYLRQKIDELKEVQKALEDVVTKQDIEKEKVAVPETKEVAKPNPVVSSCSTVIQQKTEVEKEIPIPKKEEQKDTKKDDVIDDFEKSYREFIEKLKKEMLEQEQSVEEIEEYDDWDWDIT